MPVRRLLTGSFGSNYEWIPNGPLSFRLDLLGGPTAMPKQSRLSALKAVKTAKLHILISTRTELLRNLELTDKASAGINALLMCLASMAGPVFDEKTGTLSLCSLGQRSSGQISLKPIASVPFNQSPAK
jgi:hypothetical protein